MKHECQISKEIRRFTVHVGHWSLTSDVIFCYLGAHSEFGLLRQNFVDVFLLILFLHNCGLIRIQLAPSTFVSNETLLP